MITPDYDYIVVTTDLHNTILAAALARAGRRVLLTDANPYYGGFDATLTCSEFESLYHSRPPPQCLIDLHPRLLLARGALVSVLADSGVARYLELHAFGGSYYIESPAAPQLSLLRVPHSKSEIFASKDLALAEKRQLMRFLQSRRTAPLDELEPGRALARPQNATAGNATRAGDDWSSSTLGGALSRDLPPRLAEVMAHCVAQSPPAAPSQPGLARIEAYLNSLGRFGATPFIAPCFGTGELVQAFARLCAVHGGVCALKTALSASGELTARLDAPQPGLPDLLTASRAILVSPSSAAPLRRLVRFGPVSLLPTNAVLTLPPLSGLILDSSSRCCPAGTFLLHLWGYVDSFDSLRLAADRILPEPGLWTCCFDLPVPDEDLEQVLARAQRAFEVLEPGAAFLPPSQAELAVREAERAEALSSILD